MQYRQLGHSDIQVSSICLGTMTWGEQNTEAEGHQQLDYALDRGVNFFDTAEMYPIPPKAETYTQTETIIGRWSKMKTDRDKIIMATKAVGPGFGWVRGGEARLNRQHIVEALDNSLKRLQTDYIDLYQLHWPERRTNFFGQRGYKHSEIMGTEIEETMEVLDEIVKSGKVRTVGLSNETPWGTSQYLLQSKLKNQTRIVSIQNPYNLLNRLYEVGMAEMSCREKVGLLAYSPLGFGVLSGKYLGGAKPKGARLSIFEGYGRYTKPNGLRATEMYVELARKHGLDPAQLALAFVTSRPFVTSNIIGATNLDQLKSNIDSADIQLTDEILSEIDEIQEKIPNPAP